MSNETNDDEPSTFDPTGGIPHHPAQPGYEDADTNSDPDYDDATTDAGSEAESDE